MTIKSRMFNDEQVQFILDHYKGITTYQLADMLNERFNLNVTQKQMRSFLQNHHLSNGLQNATKFKPGCISHNKGKRMSAEQYEACKRTMFKKGSIPPNHRNLGEEREDKDGYVYVKVADGLKNKNWKLKHHVLWERVNGVIPPGHKLVFLDGNKRNFDLENLMLVCDAVHVRVNKNRGYSVDGDISKSNVLIESIKHEVRKKVKK